MIISEINSFLGASCTEQHSSTVYNQEQATKLQVFLRPTTILQALLF